MMPKGSLPLIGSGFTQKLLRGDLIKAGRALANMSAQDLANATALGIATIKRAESAPAGKMRLTSANADRIVEAFRARGVVFIPNGADGMGHGVRLVSPATD